MNRKSIMAMTMGFVVLIAMLLSTDPASAEDPNDIAKELANTVASLISVPFQLNYDENIGLEDEGSRWVLNIQPVIPFSINDRWNLITRTIVPLIDLKDIPVKVQDQSGLGNIVASQFFSPKALTDSGRTGSGRCRLISAWPN